MINGIPRLLPDELASVSFSYHHEFFQRHPAIAEAVSQRCRDQIGGSWAAERRTVASYSYQWRKFKDMYAEWEQVFRDSIRPIDRDFFPGKVGLDAGCGFGRSLRYAAGYGAEMIGMDLSEAIEAAAENTRNLPRVHLVQGDILHPPIRPASLDFVYSIGVLHHLPDPKGGFLSLSRLLKAGAPIFIWVYHRGRGRQIAIFTLMRAVSVRLPFRVVDAVAFALAAMQWLLWIAPSRVLAKFSATRKLSGRLPFAYYARYPFRVLHTDWVDGLLVPLQNYYKPDEIHEWFRDAGHERVSIDSDWNGRALGYAPRV